MNLSQVFSELLAAAKSDEEKALLPLIAAAATNIAVNPTAPNFVAQGSALLAGAIAAQPGIAQDIIKDLALVINTEAQSLIPK
jgi:hypothetical protein